MGDGFGGWDGQSVAEIVPECDFELGAGLGEADFRILSYLLFAGLPKLDDR